MTMSNWGLQQGLMGVGQQTLAPSLASIGPNRYLTREDFIKMLGVALLLHGAVAMIASLFPSDRVKDIPVQPLSFKIGDADRTMIAAPRVIPQAPVAPPPAPVVKVPAAKVVAPKAPPPKVAAPKPVATVPWRANKAAPQPVNPTPPPMERKLPPENPTPSQPASPATTPSANAAPAPAALPDPALLNQPAVAANPQRFVRETGMPDPAAGSGAPANDHGTQAAQEARARYEQVISEWIQKHKLYPAQARGAKGRAIVRFQIDRSGNVRDYGIEQSSGNTALDAAAIDMVRRANPVPAVPVDYPAGSLIQFILPINFSPPQ